MYKSQLFFYVTLFLSQTINENVHFLVTVKTLVKAYKKFSSHPAWAYMFDYDPKGGLVKHSSDLRFILRGPFDKPEEEMIARRMSRLWTNFAISGNPEDQDLKWPPATGDDNDGTQFAFLRIAPDFSMETKIPTAAEQFLEIGHWPPP